MQIFILLLHYTLLTSDRKESRFATNIKKEEIIKKHVLAYNYSAALDIAETLPDEMTTEYKDLLKLAYARVLLDFKSVDKMIEKTKIQCLPVRSSSQRKYFEYALNMELTFKKRRIC